MIFTFPACFYPYTENGGGYLAVFPDLPGCTTGGKTLEEAIYMAEDAACGWLFSSIEDGETIPLPSDIKQVKANEYPGGFVNVMRLDVDEFIRKTSPKSTHKNCTVPLWLSNIADKKGINFSYVLCEGLKKQLGLSS